MISECVLVYTGAGVCVFNIEYLFIIEPAESGLSAPSLGSISTKTTCCMNYSVQKTLLCILMHPNKQCITRRSEYILGRKSVAFSQIQFNVTPLLEKSSRWDLPETDR